MDEALFWRIGLENFAGVVSSLASLATVIVAVWGVVQWKKQKIWDHSLDVGRNLLRAVQFYQSEVEASFSPFGLISEMFKAADSKEPVSFQPTMSDTETGYKRLGRRVAKARREIEIELQEAATLWGDEVLEWIKPLRDLNGEYEAYFSIYFVAQGIGDSPEVDEIKDTFRAELSQRRTVVDVSEWSGGLPPPLYVKEEHQTEHMIEVNLEIANLKKRVREKMALPRKKID